MMARIRGHDKYPRVDYQQFHFSPKLNANVMVWDFHCIQERQIIHSGYVLVAFLGCLKLFIATVPPLVYTNTLKV